MSASACINSGPPRALAAISLLARTNFRDLGTKLKRCTNKACKPLPLRPASPPQPLELQRLRLNLQCAVDHISNVDFCRANAERLGASTPPGINTVVLIQNHLTLADHVRTALLPPHRLRPTIQALLLFIA